MELEKIILNEVTQTQKDKMLTLLCILDAKQRITWLQSTHSEKLDNKEDTKDTGITLGRGNRLDLLSKLRVGHGGKVMGHGNMRDWGNQVGAGTERESE